MFADFKAQAIGGSGAFPCTLKVSMEAALARQLIQELERVLNGKDEPSISFYLSGQPIQIEGLGSISKWKHDTEIVKALVANFDAALLAAQVAHKLAQRERHSGFRRHEELRRMARNARFFADALEREAMVLEEEMKKAERGGFVK